MRARRSGMSAGRANFAVALGAGLTLAVVLVVAAPVQARGLSASRAAAPAQAMSRRPGSAKLDASHAALERLAGDYSRVVKFLGQSGAAAAPSYGTATFSVVLGGRFIVERSKDVVFGRPIEGLRIYGYDDETKQYEMARTYTMSTAITMMKGASSDGGRTIDYTGETENPGMGTVALRARLHWASPNRFSVTMSMIGPGGKEIPFQETIYTRKK
jgi:Protein of unknown function (DUF1579)